MTTLRALGAMPGALAVAGARLRRGADDRVLIAFAALWLWFLMTGFRAPWQPIEASIDSGSLRRQLVFTIAGLWALRALLRTGTLGQLAALQGAPIALGAWMSLSLLWSVDHWLTVKRTTIYWLGCALLLVLVHGPRRPVRLWLVLVTGIAAATALASLAAASLFPPECTSIALRPGLAGVAAHPNVLGPCLQLGLVASLALDPPRGRARTLLRASQVAIAIALLRTDSVTSIVSALAAIGVFVALTASTYRAGAIRLAAFAAVVVVVAIGFDSVRDTFLATAQRDATLSGRDALWSAVFAEGLREPMFGVGYGAFWHADRGLELTGTWNPKQSHHAWLDVFVELGVIGVVLVLSALVAPLWTTFARAAGPRGTPRRRAVAAIVAAATTLCGISAFSESFLLRCDKLQFFVLLWGVMLLRNRDDNRVEVEFGAGDGALPAARVLRRPVQP